MQYLMFQENKRAHKLISRAGLAPSLYQSGSVERRGRITKQGSKLLRWVMVECARVAVVHDARLCEFYERVKRRRGSRKRANCQSKIL